MEKDLKAWVDKIAFLCRPKNIVYCTGSDPEYESLVALLIKNGTATALNPQIRPNSFLCRSDPRDVARVEECTFICSPTQEEAGPTNNWKHPEEMKSLLGKRFQGCMVGRTLYVIPFCMGPLDSPLAVYGVQITDSPYVVCNMRWMTRIGDKVREKFVNQPFVPCVHSVGAPLSQPNITDSPWPCNPDQRVIAHFPHTREIWSYGSGYGGNALLGKKCVALRIASVMAKDQGWLAEHMLILGITNPQGKKKYFLAAFPSACGKTNLAMMQPTLPGWKIETVGDDIAWIKPDGHGGWRAINPEAGFFGVAPGTSMQSNPNAMKTIAKNTIFTNVALLDNGDVWWEGEGVVPPSHAINWLGHSWTPNSTEKGAHPNARFTVAAAQCPVIDPLWESPEGVPISAVILGGRRSSIVPLVTEALNWAHGVLMGASMSSETTAAAAGATGTLRHDPFAMLPFCGYHMGDYFNHWLSMQTDTAQHLPKIYSVNWFQKNQEGVFLWPGFGDNVRVLKWIFERTDGHAHGAMTPIGIVPTEHDIDQTGLTLTPGALHKLLSVDCSLWLEETSKLEHYFAQFSPHFPAALSISLNELKKRLQSSHGT